VVNKGKVRRTRRRKYTFRPALHVKSLT